MNTVLALQASFQSALLQDCSAQEGLLGGRGVAQFAVYREAYRARLRDALRENYEVLPQVMGDAAFDALALAYIAAHPSTHYSLRWFGDQLAAFMESHDTLVDHPAMVDLARLEWAQRCAFDAPDTAPLTAAELAAVPAEDWAHLRFGLHPSAHVLALQWAVGPVWHAVQAGQEEIDPPEAANHPLLVWRQGLRTHWKSMTDLQYAFAQGLIAEESFGQLCARVAAQVGEDQAAQAAATLLGEFLGGDMLCRIPSAEDTP